MQFREGLQRGWFEMLRARNEYRSWCEDSSLEMHKQTLHKWIHAIIILICPICPHWSENMWQLIGKQGLAVKAPWPVADQEDKPLTRKAAFLRDSIKTFRAQAKKAKKGTTQGTILLTDSYPEWKVTTLEWMQTLYTDSFTSDFMTILKTWVMTSFPDKKTAKFAMQFASWIKKEVEDVGPMAMDIQMPYDQKFILMQSRNYIEAQLKLKNIEIINIITDSHDHKIPDKIIQNVSPGRPYLWMH